MEQHNLPAWRIKDRHVTFLAGWFFERRVDPVGLNGFAYGLGVVGTLGTRQRGKPAAQRRPAPPSTTFQMSRSALAPFR